MLNSEKGLRSYRGLDHGLNYLSGLSDLNPWTLRAMMRPHSYTGTTFWHYYNETIEMMREFLHTKATLIPIVGPGRVAMDAAMNNFLEPGDRLLMVDNGYWGRYPDVMAENYGFETVPLTGSNRRPVDPTLVEKKLREEGDIKVVHIMQVETETGLINPIKKIGEIVHRAAPNALYIVDSATAFPGNKLDVDEWGIDVCYFLSHKGFNAPSGLTFMAVNDKAMRVLQKRATRPRSWYTSLQTWIDIWTENKSDGRHCLESFPNVILYAMRAKLDLMSEMGEEKYLRKYELAAKAVRMALRMMTEDENSLMYLGPRCDGCPGCDARDPNVSQDGSGRFCSQTVVCLSYPQGTDWRKLADIIEERYWITCPHFGFGDSRKDGAFYSGNAMRVGLVNDEQHYPRNIISMITALALALKESCGEHIRLERAIEAAAEVTKEMQEQLDWRYYDEK